MRDAPTLDGLDLERLPELLTKTHAWIAALRLRVGEQANAPPGALAADLRQLRRLARTYSVYSVALSDDHRKAAAYVAATAYRLLDRAAAAGLVQGPQATFLRRDEVSNDLSATLLYLVAGQTADARETADTLKPYEPGTAASSLITGIVWLCRGELSRVVGLRTGDVARVYEGGEDPATEALWQHLTLGVRVLAARLLGDEQQNQDVGDRDAKEIFEAVKGMCVARPAERQGLPATAAGLIYGGPHHVASLLLAAADGLLSAAVVNVPAPPGVPETEWRSYLREVAGRRGRPFLWPNHQEVIAQGMLRPGVSTVASFPTGAGKSTLSELKIAATVFRNRRAIFLAPTRALVWQTYQALVEAFPDVAVAESPVGENTYEETESAANGSILVMTPERCLTFLGTEPGSFAEVDLIVFDECHLLHPRDGVRDRRSLDAMLCFLGLLDVAPQADVVLLSAMMRNATELSRWIGFATGGRPCIEASVAWKPTRQVRGCLVFQAGDVDELKARVEAARPKRRPRPGQRKKGPSTVLKRSLTVHPYGVFGLTQTWLPRVGPNGFALLPLLAESVTLAVNAKWQLTPNKNEVAALLAARMARVGIKVLVFVQNKDHCASVSRSVSEELQAGDAQLAFRGREQAYFDTAVEELGDASLVIGPSGTGSAVHHSLLLPPERRLSESVFARTNGVNVLIATPTLAQGMNLPAEAVIIVGDHRFDAGIGERTQIAAHELLNAAGRAGRAGHHASGVVVVVPDHVIRVAPDLSTVDATLQELNGAMLSRIDQCLDITDPIELLLDRVEVSAAEQNKLVKYFVTRLPVSEDAENPSEAATRVLGRSLAAYRASTRRNAAGFQTKLETALAVRKAIAELPEQLMWIDLVSSRTGYAPARVQQMARALQAQRPGLEASAVDWMNWTVAWLQSDSTLALDLIDRELLDDALAPHEIPSEGLPGQYSAVLPLIARRIEMWMSGATLKELEAELSPPYSPKHQCKAARQFVGRFIVEFAHLAGTVAHVRREQIDHSDSGEAVPLSLAILGACVREGLYSPEQLAVRYETDVYVTSRLKCRALGRELAALTAQEEVTFAELRARAFTLARRPAD